MAIAVQFIVCDYVREDPTNQIRVDAIGLLTQMRSYASPPFPLLRPQFCVFLLIAEPDPIMSFNVQIVRTETGDVVQRTRTLTGSFPGGRDQLAGVSFKIHDTWFPAPGVYLVECWSGGTRLARQRLYLTA